MAAIDDLDSCAQLYDSYISRMNNLHDKTWMARQLIIDTDDERFCFLGSYLTYPEKELRNILTFTKYSIIADSGEELKDYYGNQVDADLFQNVKKNLSDELQKKIKKPGKCKYICFVIGGIIHKDNVSHHIGFIYNIDENILRILDPGRQSWGPQTAIEVKNVCMQAFRQIGLIPIVIETYSKKRGLCGSCILKNPVNPQDITRGTTYEEYVRYNKPLESTNREAFCQSWSILLILADIQKIMEGTLIFSNSEMDYWDDELVDLEICIRKFILWIIKRNIPTGIFTQEYLDKMERCFQMYNPLITVPNDRDIICNNNLSLLQFDERVRKDNEAKAARAAAVVARNAAKAAKAAAASARSRTSSVRPRSRGRTTSVRPLSRGRTSSVRPRSRGRTTSVRPLSRGRTSSVRPRSRGRTAAPASVMPSSRGRTTSVRSISRSPRRSSVRPRSRSRIRH